MIIDYLASILPQNGSDFIENLFDTDFLISVAVKIEVLGFDDLPDKITKMEDFMATATVFPLDEIVTKQTILLRRKYKKLKLGNAIIAATALVHGFTVVSRNTKDFENIEGLNCLNAHNL